MKNFYTPRAERLTLNLCEEIDFLEGEIKRLEEERDYYKTQYCNLIDGDLKHGQKIMVGMLALAIKPIDNNLARKMVEKVLK